MRQRHVGRAHGMNDITKYEARMAATNYAMTHDDGAAAGLAETPLHFDFVMGLRGAIPATVENLVHLKNTIPAGATWRTTRTTRV